MSDAPQGQGWWQASDGQWYPPPQMEAQPFGAPRPFAAQPYTPGLPPPVYGTEAGWQVMQSGPRTNGLAIASLCCSVGGVVLGLLTCGILAPAVIVGIVLGHVSLHQLKQNPTQQGRGMALGGVITGWVTVALGVLLILALFLG
jgi:hypothetical protein